MVNCSVYDLDSFQRHPHGSLAVMASPLRQPVSGAHSLSQRIKSVLQRGGQIASLVPNDR